MKKIGIIRKILISKKARAKSIIFRKKLAYK